MMKDREKIIKLDAECLDDEDYREGAREEYMTESIDFDGNAVVSRGDDDGAYVQAWVWVSDDSAIAAHRRRMEDES